MATRQEQQSLLATKETNRDSFDHLSQTGYGSPSNEDPLVMSIDEAIDRLGYGRFQYNLFFAAGLCMMTGAIELLLLSFLTVVLRASDTMTNQQTNNISASVFLGAVAGSLVLGGLADRWGRKPLFFWTATLIAFFGLATGFAPNYYALLFCRFWVGFGVGGLSVPFNILAEFLPDSHRGHNLLAVEFFWTAGSLLVVVLAYFTLGQGSDDATNDTWHSWRVFVILCAVPCIFSTLWGLYCIPESPRWLLEVKNDRVGALRILRQAAKINGKNPMQVYPPNTVLECEEGGGEASAEAGIMDLFSPKWFRTTLHMWGTWVGFSFVYYGNVIATTMVFAVSQNTAQHVDLPPATYQFNYGALLVSTSAEILGVAAIVLTVDTIGRIDIQFVCYLLGGVFVLTLCLLASSEHHEHYFYSMVALAFGTRMLLMAASCTTWVSTSEILTTDIRSTGHSAANAMARIGGFIVPYVVSPATKLTTIGYSMFAVAIFTSYCAWSLPETKGMDLGTATLKKPQSKDVGQGSSITIHV